jgi:thiosulfate/3-mercaptopyruvate sulfurtransferase
MATSTEGFVHPEFIVETDWLANHLDDPGLRVLDCTVHIEFDPEIKITSGKPDFLSAHIPGAQFVDVLTELSDPHQPVPLMGPDAKQFSSVMSTLGIEPGTRVVLYSAGIFYWATRVWWLLRTFGFDNAGILNGGWQKWHREGRPTETGTARPRPPGNFVVQEQRSLMASKQEVLDAIGNVGICTLNALPARQHEGTSGVSNYARRGHIKGSVNMPSDDLLDPATNEFLPAPELRRRFDSIGAFRGSVITYCGGGIAASADAMALVMLGHPDVKLYDGSLFEWAADAHLPMETG